MLLYRYRPNMLDDSTIPHLIMIMSVLNVVGRFSSRTGRLRIGQQVSAQLASSKQYWAKGNRVRSIAAQIVGEPRVTNVKAGCGHWSYLVTLSASPVVGPVRNTSRNLPICTSSPFASTAQSTGSRLT